VFAISTKKTTSWLLTCSQLDSHATQAR
jgi:hypothetical protein